MLLSSSIYKRGATSWSSSLQTSVSRTPASQTAEELHCIVVACHSCSCSRPTANSVRAEKQLCVTELKWPIGKRQFWIYSFKLGRWKIQRACVWLEWGFTLHGWTDFEKLGAPDFQTRGRPCSWVRPFRAPHFWTGGEERTTGGGLWMKKMKSS